MYFSTNVEIEIFYKRFFSEILQRKKIRKISKRFFLKFLFKKIEFSLLLSFLKETKKSFHTSKFCNFPIRKKTFYK